VRAIVLALLACLVGACDSGREAEPDAGLAPRAEPAPAAVRAAARETLGAGPADIGIDVSSGTAAYTARGGIELAQDRFRVHVSVARAPLTHFTPYFDVAGIGGETYLVQPPDIDPTGRCWFDPHAPVGALGGAASLQEAVAVAGISVRLLRDGVRSAERVGHDAGGGTSYQVSVDPGKARLASHSYRGDELGIVGPRRLARHLGAMRVRVGRDGLVRRLSFELRRFRPARRGPGLVRERRRERVSIAIELSGYGRPLGVRAPRCIAME
jgi:hypothetical protein